MIVRLINLDDPANPECIVEAKVETLKITANRLKTTWGAGHAWDTALWEISVGWFKGRRFHKIEIVRDGEDH